ncbi:winged helix-turn-helix transcriptional regulator [Mucilaginibacter pocheonensis]|uniref:DNA-binding HxlR family transcriptional regulator n=1 Tax=Mucilaginibacter pocheonensis TaxID=398050 RepID=A0ABU1THF5_9SPHI|nr:helix-turn-helix domain-containing protein [Mucilaginibacter pocheonensis]MDR6944807.1 DNA-binding HxlR family transcriptional regulator [Mucilaginibacter pocheonensis]
MEAKEYDTYSCPVGKTIELISGRWKPIILYLVQHDINRFGLLQKRMPKISRKVLTEQLREMENQGLIEREIRVSSYPQEVFYFLTEKGSSLRGLIDQIFNWGIVNLLDDPSRKRAMDLVIDHN